MEYRKRCKVCGKIWCYTDDDLANDKLNNVTSAFNAIGGMASALGGTVFHNQYFADRMENDERKRVNRNQCPECRSLDSETISAEELENYKIQESFSKVQVSINSNATTENLLTRAKLLLEDKDWASANAYCDNVLDTEPENGIAYLYKLMAELQVSQLEELKDKHQPFDNKASYQRVMRFGDDSVKKLLQSYNEHIKIRNENERQESIYSGALNRINTASTNGEFEAIAAIFGTIASYKDALTMQQNCLKRANEMRANEEAKARQRTKTALIVIPILLVCLTVFGTLFTVILPQNAYEKGLAEYEAENYKEAASHFQSCSNYKDASELLLESKYLYSLESIEQLNYTEADKYLTEIGDYKNSADLAKSLISKDTDVGDIVIFGSYEQDNNSENGKENIEWQVLQIEDNRILMLSHYILDYQPYHSVDEKITWENCSLRKWLNNDFYNDAFNEYEQAIIPTSKVAATKTPGEDTDPGNDTMDKVFLLSAQQAQHCLSSLHYKGSVTQYAKHQGMVSTKNGNYVWYLRSPGAWQDAASVVFDSEIINGNVDEKDGIRPAIWIDLSGIK